MMAYCEKLEQQQKIEASATINNGCFVSEIHITPVESGHYVVPTMEADLLQALRETNTLMAAWRLTGRRPTGGPHLVPEVVDAATGEALDPITLTPLPPNAMAAEPVRSAFDDGSDDPSPAA